ncbi:MAG TPA: YdeI/OmpD-associated family protein [Thermoanaerobaculia bacterium]|jgi:uncharacterized protein YdeI (YjbR/CyaY-like superfamily)
MKVQFFASQQAFREWLEQNHSRVTELFVGFYKKDSGRGGLTYKEAVDESLCFGWIDGVVKKIDDVSYMHRFTPRKKKSYWSAVNTKRFAELQKLGLIAPPGQAAFDARDTSETQRYAFERDTPAELSPELEKKFRANEKAWAFFQAQTPSYRRTVTFQVMNAKQEETRVRRLEKLIADCAAGKRT